MSDMRTSAGGSAVMPSDQEIAEAISDFKAGEQQDQPKDCSNASGLSLIDAIDQELQERGYGLPIARLEQMSKALQNEGVNATEPMHALVLGAIDGRLEQRARHEAGVAGFDDYLVSQCESAINRYLEAGGNPDSSEYARLYGRYEGVTAEFVVGQMDVSTASEDWVVRSKELPPDLSPV